jgi:hypothetical protein
MSEGKDLAINLLFAALLKQKTRKRPFMFIKGKVHRENILRHRSLIDVDIGLD